MNFGPQNQQSLLDLITGLKNGMDPSQAYGITSDIMGQQAQTIANRQQRLSGLADMLSGVAMQGMPFSGASALAEAQPGPAGPAVQNMLSALYGDKPQAPQGGYQPQLLTGTTSNGTYMQDWQSGQEQKQAANQQYNNSISPAFQPAQPTPTEAIAIQEQQQTTQTQQILQSFAVDASKFAMQGMDMQTFLQNAAQSYPELFSTPEGIKAVQQIALTVFNAPTAQGV